MFGWFSAAIVRASCSNRRYRSVSFANASGNTYRDIAPKPGVPCTEYFSHAASAERSEDFIGA